MQPLQDTEEENEETKQLLNNMYMDGTIEQEIKNKEKME